MIFSSRKRTIPFFNFIVVLAMLLALVPATTLAAPASDDQNRDKLGKEDRELVAKARTEGKSTVTMMVAAQPGTNASLASQAAAFGGTVKYQEDTVEYLRVEVPVDNVETFAKLSNVKALTVDRVIPLDDPRPDAVQPVTPQPAPGAATPNNNPYMPIGDTGASQFMAAHPRWDGRGVTVGIVDSGIDLDHPALEKTTTGERKIIEWVTGTDPLSDDDPTWVNMESKVTGTTFTFNGQTYTAPTLKKAAFRIGLFNERDSRLGGEINNDVNRDGNPAGSKGTFAVLWDTTSNKVYVDTNQNNKFTDDQAMTDYSVAYDIGHFGTDNPATAIREQIPFVVQTSKFEQPAGTMNYFVNIGIISGAHGTHVAGIVSGNKLFGGAMSGAAPGTKIVSSRACLFVTGCTSHALFEGMIFVAKYKKVDIINMSIGGLPALNDGNNTRAVLYDNLIEKYKVQMFISAGNSGAGINTIGDPSVASRVMSVGSYISKATWQKNYGSDSNYQDNLHGFSSRGPREDGGFKPNIIAPGSAVSSVPTWQSPVGACLPYACPVGYAMFQGTSMASPQAAGAAALLVSAAKQRDEKPRPGKLRQAINSTARFIDNYQAFEQGNGLIDVNAAWKLLNTDQNNDFEDDSTLVEIISEVPVTTVLSGFLKKPGIGQGIYDREGVKVNDTYTRTYTFTRTTGGNDPATYNLSFAHNDGTFSLATTSITLKLNSPVNVTVTVNPKTSGVHSAILNLDNPKTQGIDYQTLNVVIAASQFNVGNNYTVVNSGSIGRNQSTSFFFQVPAKTPAFKVDLAGNFSSPGGGQVRFLRFHPYGVGIESNSTPNCYNPSAGPCSGNSLTRTVSNPFPGVWEVVVEARRTSDAASAPFSLTASILGASVSPNPDTIASATINTPVARSYTLTNLFGAFTGRAVGTTLGSAKYAVPSINNHTEQRYDVVVTPGSTSLRATIGGTSDLGADLDLYLYNCTSGTCVLAGQSADGDSEESVTINNPAAGTWMVLIDGYAVPAGTTTYNYVDVFVNPGFGSLDIPETAANSNTNTLRPAGSSWTVSGTVTAKATPADERVLVGNVLVRTDTNITIGSGDVVIKSVTP
jgi:subtilisin family serine protease